MKAKIVLDHPEAIMPTRATDGSAGYDLYSVEKVTLWPNERKTISTGLRLTTPGGTYLRVAPRSGLAHKKGIHVMGGVIDHDYTGLLGVILYNTHDRPMTFEVGDRIAQGIFERYETPELEEVASLDETLRGEGGYGSSGQ